MAPPSADALRWNVRKVLVLAGAWMFLVIMPVVVPFLRHHGLDMTEVFALQAIFAVAVVALEVPSGYAADVLGRRGCLIVASAFYGSAFTLLAFADGFGQFVAFEVLAAVGASLYSGADVALLYDSLEALDARGEGRPLLGRRLFWAQVGETLAALLCAALLAASGQDLRWPAAVGAVTAWAPLLIALTLVEPPRARLSGSHRQNARRIAAVLWRESATLRLVLINLMAYGLATLLAVWAFQDYWRDRGVPLELFGILWAAFNLTVALSARFTHALERRAGERAVLLAIGVLPVAAYFGMAACGAAPATPVWAALGIGAGLLLNVCRGLTQVVLRDALNSRVEGDLRATANSVASLGVRLGFAVTGLLLGWGIDAHGYPLAFAAAGAAYVGAFLLLLLPLVHRLGASEATPTSARPAPPRP